MTVVNTNLKALFAEQAMVRSQRDLLQATGQLSSGQRINSAADDAAGAAISSIMATQVSSLSQSVRNANDAISMLETADGAAQGLANILHRMKELTVQHLNGSYGPNDLGYIETEFDALKSQMQSIVTDTKWNGYSVLSDSSNTTRTFQVGLASSDQVTVNFADFSDNGSSVYNAYSSLDLSSDPSSTLMDGISDALEEINTARASWGAGISVLAHSADNANNMVMNLSVSRSRIQDTDYAQATADLARAQIMQQAGTAMLTQANQLPYMVMALLR
jgi:flagellin